MSTFDTRRATHCSIVFSTCIRVAMLFKYFNNFNVVFEHFMQRWYLNNIGLKYLVI